MTAIIDIGSNTIRMRIYEKGKKGLHGLEFLETTLALGHDTFSIGQISSKKVDELCNILLSYKKVAMDYSIENIFAIATTAFREAKNRDYVTELIYSRTGITVKVLDDLEEKAIIHKEIKRKSKSKYTNSLLAYVGTGSLGVSLIEKGSLQYSQNIRIGSLKLNEILEPVQGFTKKFHKIVEQYINTYIDTLKSLVSTDNVEYFIATGKEINLFAKIFDLSFKKNFITIPKKKYNLMYDNIKGLTSKEISEKFSISLELADSLLPTMAIFKILMDFSNANEFIGYDILINDYFAYNMLFPDESHQFDEDFEYDIVTAAIYIANRYNYDSKHSKAVAEYSMQIYDTICDSYNLGKRERLLLLLSAILHDIGKYINIKSHYTHSYYIIKNLELIGLNSREIEIVANASYYHSNFAPNEKDENYSTLTLEEQMIVSKISAILRLADSLDKSHLQKFDNLTISVSDNVLIVQGEANQDIALEEWAFKKRSNFFSLVFGIDCKLIKERKI